MYLSTKPKTMLCMKLLKSKFVGYLQKMYWCSCKSKIVRLLPCLVTCLESMEVLECFLDVIIHPFLMNCNYDC